jgi:tryptophanyl-tRNA synthetase
MVPEIAELAVYYPIFVTDSSLRHNPTIEFEAAGHGVMDRLSYFFLGYPVSQAADITFYKAHRVPVGSEQAPHVELARKFVRRFNAMHAPVLVEPEVLLCPSLIGLDGKTKMNESLGHCIYLRESVDMVDKKVTRMYTDPKRTRRRIPGRSKETPYLFTTMH